MKILHRTILVTMTAAWMMANPVTAQNVNYNISGKVAGNVKKINVIVNAANKPATIVNANNGHFTVKGTVPRNTFVTLKTDENQELTIMPDGQTRSMDLTTGTVVGSQTNTRFAKAQQQFAVYDQEGEKLYGEYTKLVMANDTTALKDVTEKLEQLFTQQSAAVLNYALQNKDKLTTAYFIAKYMYNFEPADLNKLVDEKTAYYNLKIMDKPKARVAALSKRMPGIRFHDLEMFTPKGEKVKLSQWVGKDNYVLVDFWASWCGPCRAEMPNVVNMYNKYHGNKNFEIVGVSFDSKAESWEKGIKDLNMPWPQMSDLKGWQSAAQEAYGIMGIPSNVLVNPEGVIVGADLRGTDLQKKLKEIFGE